MGNNIFGNNLKILRKEKGLTLDELTQEVNNKYGVIINKGNISRWENGISNPSLSHAAIMARYFNISLHAMAMKEIKNYAEGKS